MPTMLGPEKFVWPTPFDAGPNAVVYTLEEYLPEVTALLLKFFPPARGQDMKDYVNKPVDASVTLDPALIKACEGKTPQPGTVKYFYQTQPGPGPQVLTDKEANLDPKTGLNTYQPSK